MLIILVVGMKEGNWCIIYWQWVPTHALVPACILVPAQTLAHSCPCVTWNLVPTHIPLCSHTQSFWKKYSSDSISKPKCVLGHSEHFWIFTPTASLRPRTRDSWRKFHHLIFDLYNVLETFTSIATRKRVTLIDLIPILSIFSQSFCISNTLQSWKLCAKENDLYYLLFLSTGS